MSIPRRKDPVGWDDTAFQVWNRIGIWPALGVPCVPLLGKYGPDYMPALPFVIVELPASAAKVFPEALREALEENVDDDVGTSEPPVFLVLVYPRIDTAAARHSEVNLLMHPWALPHVADLEEKSEVVKPAVGVFPVSGVEAVNEILSVETSVLRSSLAAAEFREVALGGVAFGKLRTDVQFIHNECLSPDNMKLCVFCGDCRLSAFFSAAQLEHQSIAALHVLPSDEATEDTLRHAVAAAPDVATLRKTLPKAVEGLGAKEAGDLIASLIGTLCISTAVSASSQGMLDHVAPPAAATVFSENRRLRVEVANSKGRPIKGATVELYNRRGIRVATTATDSSGVARINASDKDRLEMRIANAGYRSQVIKERAR